MTNQWHIRIFKNKTTKDNKNQGRGNGTIETGAYPEVKRAREKNS